MDDRSLNTDMLSEDYLLNRLVYINSANHAYSEILLDTHMAMFGNNNVGKTASLAGMKLLLFPEVDFYRCESKFKFKGKEGVYSMEDSYDFYFPDARSFIVLEVNNPEGAFCMVLYKTNNYGYGRFFIPVSYDQMRGVFWDNEAGHFAQDISVSSISKFAKKNKGRQVTDTKEISSLMFSSYSDATDRKRFCALPLKDGRKDSVDAFRNIYQLAFETGSLSSNTLPNAIAALLEMGRSRDQERLDANLTELTEQHTQLYNQGEWLQKISNVKPEYDIVLAGHKRATEALNDYSEAYYSAQQALDLAKKNHAPVYQKVMGGEAGKKRELQGIKNQLTDLTKSLNANIGAQEQIEKQLKKKEDSLVKAKSLESTYAGKGFIEILEIIEEGLKVEETKLKELQKENGVARLLEANIKDQLKIKKKVNGLSELIKDDKLSVLNQLNDPDSASVLYTINPAFTETSADLSDADKAAILSFTGLFKRDNAGYLTFLNKAFGNTKASNFNLEEKRVEWEKTVVELTEKLMLIDKEIRLHSKVTTKERIEELIKATEKSIKGFGADIESIKSISTLETNIEELKELSLSKKKEQRNNKEKGDLLGGQHGVLRGEVDKLSRELTRLTDQQSDFSTIEQSLSTATQSATPIMVDVEPVSEDLLSASFALTVNNKAISFAKLFADFIKRFDALSRDLSHPDVDTHKELFNLSDYDELVRMYGSAFETLEYDVNKQRNAVRSHNQLFNNQISEIAEASSLLNNFVSEINKELNDKHVSNLSEINLFLKLHPSFLELMSTLDKHDIQGEALLDVTVYVSLSKFVEKFFNKKSRRLKMADIISEINYHYRLEATNEVVTKSQSGGTTSVITAFVLSVLLRRITPSYVKLQMPIIVDEISTLDTINTDSTIKQITEHGFSIFCATPSFSSFVSQKVGRWIMIDRLMIRTPMVQGCHLNILPEQVESYGKVQA